jgi:phage terminase large subunit-like protein
MSRTAGQRQRPKTVARVARKRGRRPTVPEVEPLFHTYDAVKPPGSWFDEAAADRAVKWIEGKLRHFKGRWAGRPFYLMGWQRRLIRALFGWKRSDGTRLYRSCYCEAPRKSGKSSLASAIALYLAFGDGEASPEIAFAAYDREQAGICYSTARHMLEQSPELHAATAVYNSRKEMQLRDNPGGWLRALSRETADSSA